MRTEVAPNVEYKLVGVRWYGEGAFHRETVLGSDISAAHLTPVIPGALIYNRLFAWKESFAVVPPELDGHFVSSEFPQFSVDAKRVLPEYLYLYCLQTPVIAAVNALSAGSAAVSRNRFKEGYFLGLKIPLPPLDTQRAIVAHWQAAQAEIAMMGKRASSIEANAETHFLSQLGIEPDIPIRRPKLLISDWVAMQRWSVTNEIDTRLGIGTVPKSMYEYTTIGRVATVSYGIQKSPANRTGANARPYLRVANVQKGFLDLSEVKTIEVSPSEAGSYRLERGDVLFVEGNGSRAELGRAAIWQGEIDDCVHQNHLIKVRFDQTYLLPEYGLLWFNTSIGRGHFFRSAKTSSGLGTINSNEVRSAPIPLPPLDVQRTLVAQAQAARAQAAQLRADAVQRLANVKAELEAMILGTRAPSPLGGEGWGEG